MLPPAITSSYVRSYVMLDPRMAQLWPLREDSSWCSNVQPNHDYCDACGGKGQFLCCEGGCLRSFHFTCLEPPLELEEVPEDESWFCKACRAAAVGSFDSARRQR